MKVDNWNAVCPGRALWPHVQKTAGSRQGLEVRKSQAHLEGPKAWGFSKWAPVYVPKTNPKNTTKV